VMKLMMHSTACIASHAVHELDSSGWSRRMGTRHLASTR
jgi:hypothetical protein